MRHSWACMCFVRVQLCTVHFKLKTITCSTCLSASSAGSIASAATLKAASSADDGDDDYRLLYIYNYFILVGWFNSKGLRLSRLFFFEFNVIVFHVYGKRIFYAFGCGHWQWLWRCLRATGDAFYSYSALASASMHPAAVGSWTWMKISEIWVFCTF